MPCQFKACSFSRLGGLLTLALLLAIDFSAVAQVGRGGGRGGDGERRGGERPKIGQIFGRVKDAQTGKAIEFVSIAVLSQSDSSTVGGGITDKSGRFDIKELPVGRYIAQVMFMGYVTETVSDIRLIPKGGTVQDLGTIHLEADVQALEAAEVITQSSSLEMLIDRKVFHVGNDLNAVGSNATELLRNVPSVDVDIDGTIFLRGSANVTILIDGRPSGLTGSTGEALLEQIPSSTIDRIEIITNPSAKFDPEGMAGILNIILKKDKLRGLNGQLEGTFGTGDNHSGSFNGNWRTTKVNVFANFATNNRNGFRSGDSFRTQYFTDSTSSLDIESMNTTSRSSLSGRLGVDYSPSPRTTWNAGLRINDSENASSGWAANRETFSTDYALDQFTSSVGEGSRISQDLDAGFQRTFGSDDHNIKASVRLSQSNGMSNDSIFIQTFDGLDAGAYPDGYDVPMTDEFLAFVNSNDPENVKLNLQADYERPLEHDGKLELGWRTTDRFTVEDQQNFTADTAMNSTSQEFKYGEQIHAAYTTWGRKFGAFGLQLGGRLEQVFTSAEVLRDDGEGGNEDSAFNNDYFSLYPSVNVNYTVDDRNQWQASFSRRVNRPRSRQINPYINNANPRELRVGNPFLLPEYTNSVELNHQLTTRSGSLTSGLYYKHTTDVIRRYRWTDSSGVSTSTFVNLASQQNFGAEIVGMWRPSEKLSLRGNASWYVEQSDGSNLEADLGNSGVRMMLGGQVTAVLPRLYKLQIDGRFMAPSTHLQGDFSGFKTMNMAVSRDYFDGKLRCTARVSDVFNSRQFSFTSSASNFELESVHKRQSQFLYLSAMWKFGKLEAGNRRKGGSRGGESGGSQGGGGGDMEF